MKFDVTKSKLYGNIMEAITTFFGLDSDSTTETEIHAALDGALPIAQQIEAAKTEAVANIQSQLDALTERANASDARIVELQEQVDAHTAESSIKDERITELQTEIEAAKTSLEGVKAQHKTEVSRLAGELAKAKAGKDMELDNGNEQHAAATEKATNGAIVVQSESLKRLLNKK